MQDHPERQPTAGITPADLRIWRERMGLSQQEAAALLGYSSRAHYTRMETGDQPIPPLMAMACAAHFHRLKPWPDCAL